MKKFSFLLGAGVGFVLGSRAGSRPYERLEGTIRNLASRSETQQVVERVKSVAGSQVDAAVHKMGDRLPSSNRTDEPIADADHPAIDREAIAGGGEEVADRGFTGLEVSE